LVVLLGEVATLLPLASLVVIVGFPLSMIGLAELVEMFITLFAFALLTIIVIVVVGLY
jgi:hypothetical protein